ncbi:hypothetical protein Mal4_58490 [Maioricimonas rarisocia]|uniref:Uncharacterized protein n=1 Tax=Maioricimonas rarisocia TaxID=2528026 RepID=A0A517ZG94_9PLAN|nr:hypothetical protein Mal4_58490 [Maioricimonas rarisocia]
MQMNQRFTTIAVRATVGILFLRRKVLCPS